MKCPYCMRNNTIDEAPTNCDPKFLYPVGKSLNHPPIVCPNSNTDKCLQKKIFATFMWTGKDYFCQRVMQDKDIWKTYVENAELVFSNGILPELIGKCFTRVPKVTVYDNNDGSQFCYCKGGSHWRNVPLFSC